MSNEALEQEIQQEEIQQEQQEAKPYTVDDWRASQEEAARASGWKPLEEFIAEGGEPTKWRDAGAFNIYGDLIKTVKRKEAELDERVSNVQKLAQAQAQQQIMQLQAERDSLIEEGGRSKEVKALDGQIAKLNVPTAPPQVALLEEWNANNPWINERSPKASYAKEVFAAATREGKSIATAIELVNAEIAKEFPAARPVPQRTVPESERGKGAAGFKPRATGATMESLTTDEAKIWRTSSAMWGNDEKAFLQSVTDSRKGDK